MAKSGKLEKDLTLVEEFATVRALTADGKSVQVPKSKFGGNLEVASENVLGGIKAAVKTEEYTEEVKIDPTTGKAYVKPSSEVAVATADKVGGIIAAAKTESDTVEVKIDSETGKLYVKPSSEVAVATADKVGGIIAAAKTESETVEVKIDNETGKLYVPEGDGTPPDNEDIHVATVEGVEVLQFNDKAYSSSSYSGLGRVYLRKNMVNGVNVLTQDMIPSSNTNVRYVIQYDYDLQGAEISIPANCVLEFQGGSFSNGTLNGDATSIMATHVKIFGTDIVIGGTWNVPRAYVEWFGAVGDGTADDRLAIQKTIDSFYHTVLLAKKYRLCSYTSGHICLILPQQHILSGMKLKDVQGAFVRSNIALAGKESMPEDDIIVLAINPHCTVDNIGISGNAGVIEHDHTRRCTGISHIGTNVYRVTLSNVDVWSCYYAVNIAAWMSKFEFVICRYNLYGIVLHGILTNNLVTGVWDIYKIPSPQYSSVITSLDISRCYCNGNFLGGYYLTNISYSSMNSCAADGCGWFNRNSNWGDFPDDITTVTSNNTNPAYRFEKCKSFNVTGLGAEENVKFISTSYCESMKISCCFFYNYYVYKQYNSEEVIKLPYIISSSLDMDIIYENIKILISEESMTDQPILCTGGTGNPSKVVFKDIVCKGRKYLGVESLDSRGHLNGSSITIESKDDYAEYDMSTATYPYSGNLVYGTDFSNLRVYLSQYFKQNVFIHLKPRKVVCDCSNVTGNAISTNSSIYGYGEDDLYINGNEGTNTVLHVNAIASFRQFKSITFKNIDFNHASNNVDYVLRFDRCSSVNFINCTFKRKSSLSINKAYITALASNLSFINCSNPNEVGKTSERISLGENDKGYRYFDTTLNKPIFWTGTSWVDSTGVGV